MNESDFLHNVKEHTPPQKKSDGAETEPLKAVAVSQLVVPSSFDWVGTIYEGKHGDIRILDPETREGMEGAIQFADSKEGYYVHKLRSEDGFKTWHEIVNRPILIQRFDRNSNTWRDCLPPSYATP